MLTHKRSVHHLASTIAVGIACRQLLEKAAHGEGMGIRLQAVPSTVAAEGDGYAKPTMSAEGQGSVPREEGVGFAIFTQVRDGWDGIGREGWDDLAQPALKTNEGAGFAHSASLTQREPCLA